MQHNTLIRACFPLLIFRWNLYFLRCIFVRDVKCVMKGCFKICRLIIFFSLQKFFCVIWVESKVAKLFSFKGQIFHCLSSLLFFNANFKKLFLRQRTCFSEHTSNRIFPFIFYVLAPCYIPRGDISYIYTTLEMSFEVTSLMQTDSVYNYFLSYLFWIKSLYIFWQISH